MNEKKINILFINESTQSPYFIFRRVNEFFKEWRWQIDFSPRNTNKGYHAKLLIKEDEVASGGARIQEKKDGCYQLYFNFGELKYAPSYEAIFIHEILHLFFQEFGLGDIHKCPGGENMGQKNNRNAMEYWIKNAKWRNNKPNKSIVHHTAVKRYGVPQYNATRKYHIEVKGWAGIGYHFFIEEDGTLKIGRWIPKSGAHCIGQNYKSVGICLAGNFNVQLPTRKQKKTLQELLIYLGYKEIGPHRKYQAYRTCYGKLLSDDWAEKLIMKDKLTKEEVENLYLLIFHRLIDPEALGYVGRELSFVLDEFAKSKEWEVDDEIIKIRKKLTIIKK